MQGGWETPGHPQRGGGGGGAPRVATALPALVCLCTHAHMHMYSHTLHGEVLETREGGFNLGRRSWGALESCKSVKGFLHGREIRINLNKCGCSLSACYVPSPALGAFIFSVNPHSKRRRDPFHPHFVGDKAAAQMSDLLPRVRALVRKGAGI